MENIMNRASETNIKISWIYFIFNSHFLSFGVISIKEIMEVIKTFLKYCFFFHISVLNYHKQDRTEEIYTKCIKNKWNYK